ncbi:type IV secretion system protein (plasmid) [Skermanella mucosa]|uniref:type IV secretion system protein n=1 Tax=Skermanella mucosa TaxID=1789672 RepID=UPI00192C8145|nr:type IV secretion system protein [Skermanella mucosa]UEM24307.1 type IV secretion system protein [Skermanella mucosa]
MFGFRRSKWKEEDEYKRARWAYEGQGAAATKAAWFLGFGLIAMTGFAALQTWDKHLLASLGDLKFATIETSRTTGDVVSVSITDGELVVDETKRRQFLKWWIPLWRSVPADAVAYNHNYLTSQIYMSEPVYHRVAEYMAANPVDQFIRAGNARMVRVQNVTPTGTGTRYRVDWIESVYRHSQLVAQVPMTADIDLEQHTPRTEAEAEANIFGFVIEGFYWTPSPGT